MDDKSLATESISFKGSTWILTVLDRGSVGGFTIRFSNAARNDDETAQQSTRSSDNDGNRNSRSSGSAIATSTQTLVLSLSDVNDMIGVAETTVDDVANESSYDDVTLAQKKFRAVTLLSLVSLVDIGTPVPLL